MRAALFWYEWACACAALLLLAVLHGKLCERHEAEQWLERYFAQIRHDRESRNRLGQFLPNHQRPHHDERNHTVRSR